jgi:hypothetical protein
VTTYVTAQPCMVIPANGKTLGGVDGELLTAFAKSVSLKAKVFQTTSASSTLAVEQHKADMDTCIYYMLQRTASCDWLFFWKHLGPSRRE